MDTFIIIPLLEEDYNNCEVIAVSGNVGQADELEGVEEKALKTGASKLYVKDFTDEFVEDYIIPTVKAGRSTKNICSARRLRVPLSQSASRRSRSKKKQTRFAAAVWVKAIALAVNAFAPDKPTYTTIIFDKLNSK